MWFLSIKRFKQKLLGNPLGVQVLRKQEGGGGGGGGLKAKNRDFFIK